MIAQERHLAISSLLSSRQKMTVQELQNAINVSPATLRRDLTEMEAAGSVIRVHGAVVHPTYFRGEPSLAQKGQIATVVKRAIDRAAAELVPSHSTVLVDAGTTCLELGRLLLARRDLTILTHSLPLAARVYESEVSAKVIVLGGEVRAISGATVGAFGLSWLDQLNADWAFIGASGLSKTEGASTTELSEAAMKEGFLRRAQHKVLLADSRKWERPALVNFATWDDFDYWIMGGSGSESIAIPNQGLQVICVDKN